MPLFQCQVSVRAMAGLNRQRLQKRALFPAKTEWLILASTRLTSLASFSRPCISQILKKKRKVQETYVNFLEYTGLLWSQSGIYRVPEECVKTHQGVWGSHSSKAATEIWKKSDSHSPAMSWAVQHNKEWTLLNGGSSTQRVSQSHCIHTPFFLSNIVISITSL